MSTTFVRIDVKVVKLSVDLTIGACDGLACNEELYPNCCQYSSETSNQRTMILVNVMDIVRSPACSEALLILRAMKRSTTAT